MTDDDDDDDDDHNVLIGRVTFRLHLDQPKKKKKKKRRREEEDAECNNNLSTQEFPTSTTNEDDFSSINSSTSMVPLVGYMFHPQHATTATATTTTTTGEEFLLSVPRDLMALTHQAVQGNLLVRIHRYSLLPLLPSISTDNADIYNGSVPATAGRQQLQLPHGFIEVHANGLEVITQELHPPSTSSNDQITSTDLKDNVWTLAQIQRRERVDEIQRQTLPAYCNSSTGARARYCLVATVYSISPIITVDSDPFALLELYEPQSTCYCVAVMRRDALSCHAAIVPVRNNNTAITTRLALKHVKRQKWQVPELLMRKGLTHLQSKVPSYVFVIENTDQVIISSDSGRPLRSATEDGDDDDDTNIQNNNVYSAAPQDSLSTSLTGEVVSVHTILVGDDKEHIHYIEIRPTPFNNSITGNEHAVKQQEVVTLFLTYYPMPSALQLALRPGVHIEAVHLHATMTATTTGRPVFFACLHSNVAVLRHASELQQLSSGTSLLSSGKQQHQPMPLSLSKTSPCAFLKLSKTYLEFQCRLQLPVLLEDWQQGTPAILLPSTDEFTKAILHVLLGNSTMAGARARCVYAEFFDHVQVRKNDHADNDDNEKDGALVDTTKKACCTKAIGCHMTRHHCEQSNRQETPLVFGGLGRIYECCMRWLESRLSEYANTRTTRMISTTKKKVQGIHAGWTGSIVYNAHGLQKALDDKGGLCFLGPRCNQQVSDTTSSLIHTIGVTVLSNTNVEKLQGVLSNGRFGIPATFTETNNGDNAPHMLVGERRFVVAGVRSVLVSFLCIEVPSTGGGGGGGGESHTNSHPNNTDKTVYLPSYNGERDVGPGSAFGPCAVISRNGYLFLTSVHFDCHSLVLIGSGKAGLEEHGSRCIERPPSSLGTVQGCLDPTASESDVNVFVGLLERKFFKISKARNSSYSGIMISLTHVRLENDHQAVVSSEEVCTLQSIDMKPVVAVDQSKRRGLRRLLESSLGKGLHEDQLTLALVWWKTASCERTCALLGGGLNELVPGASSKAKSTGVLVRVPRSAMELDPKRGYLRFRCSLDELCSWTMTFRPDNATMATPPTAYSAPPALFDFVGGQRFFPGMLTDRPRRRTLSDGGDSPLRLAFGDLLIPPRHAGIPSCSLADLFCAVCADLQTRSRINVAPSLVRRITKATFLGISYCRALPECTKCFQALKHPVTRNIDNNRGIREETDGIVTSVRSSDKPAEATSFWDRPLPSALPPAGNDPMQKPEPVDQSAIRMQGAHHYQQRPNTLLRCPNNCSLDYAAIKWECSGTLDDGTGQAKLYAERDTALLLLDMPLSVAEQIESGAWLQEMGIIFSKGMPPKAYLRGAVMTARCMALDETRQRQPKCPCQEADVLKFLTRSARAEYWMQRHCRSDASRRERTYFVRCKPLSDEMARCLNQTQIELITTTPSAMTFEALNSSSTGSAAGVTISDDARRLGSKPVPTYTLPPLKLNLVDCCCTNNEW